MRNEISKEHALRDSMYHGSVRAQSNARCPSETSHKKYKRHRGRELPTYCLPSPQSATSSSLFPSPCRLLTYCLLALKVLYYNPLLFHTISRYKRLSQLSFPLMLLWIRKQECFPDCSIHRLDLLEVNMITFGIQDTHVRLSFARNKGLNNNV